MPGMRCTVAVCNNSLKVTKKDPDKSHVTYHTFPKDPIIREQWVHCCHRAGKWNADACRVCSEHFLPEDYERDLKAELLGGLPKRHLKKTAVPSVKLTDDDLYKSSQRKTERTSRQLKRARRQYVQDILTASSRAQDPPITNEAEAPTTNNDLPCHSSEQRHCKCDDYERLQQKCSNLKFITNKLERKFSDMHLKLTTKNIAIFQLKRELQVTRRKKMPLNQIHKKASEILSKVFTKNQVKILLCQKKRVCNWSNEDFVTAFTLRYLSRNAYVYLRKVMKYPLPGLSTLNKWASKMSVLQESSQAEILDDDDSEPLQPFIEDQEKPAEEPENAPETANKNFDGKTVFMWNRAATLLLINLYEQHETKFHSGTYKKKQVWQMIAKEVKAAGYRVTILQCENRWKTLMSSYRRTKFLNQLSGHNNNKICNYFAELDALVKNKRTPPAVIVRRRPVEPSTTPDKTQKKIKKKECSGDLCEILQKMEERSEKRHQERMALQRDMMNTHKHFMQSILQMMMDEKGT